MNLDSVQKTGWKYTVYILYILYFLTIFGLSRAAPQYLDTVNNSLRTYVSIFLIIRYNPFVKIAKFTDFDREIIFSSGVFLLLSTAFGKYIKDKFRPKLEKKIKKLMKKNKKIKSYETSSDMNYYKIKEGLDGYYSDDNNDRDSKEGFDRYYSDDDRHSKEGFDGYRSDDMDSKEGFDGYYSDRDL